jgi:hypothetical protein
MPRTKQGVLPKDLFADLDRRLSAFLDLPQCVCTLGSQICNLSAERAPGYIAYRLRRKETSMRFSAIFACAAIAVLALAGIDSADAAVRKKPTDVSAQSRPRAQSRSVFIERDERGRTRTRITVQRRSYLDAGTEVSPGDRKFTDYAIPPYYSPLDVLGPGWNYDRRPLNSPWEPGGWTRQW